MKKVIVSAIALSFLFYSCSDNSGKENTEVVKLEAKGGKAYGNILTVNENEFWTRSQIESGEHLAPIEAGNIADIGGEGEVRIFPNESGGLGKRFRWTGEEDLRGPKPRLPNLPLQFKCTTTLCFTRST